MLFHTNFKWDRVVTPVDINQFERLLNNANYDKDETQFLVHGFTYGFDIGYRGPETRRNLSRNLPFRIGTPLDLWNKVMKEVAENRYAGPYCLDQLPFKEFVQSPIGLVPKSGNKQWLIFHLLHDFGSGEAEKLINYHTPHELCTVKYKDLDHAVECCLKLLESPLASSKGVVYAKSDFSNALRILPVLIRQHKFLTMMASHPPTHKNWYFVDLCLPFGSSRSCVLFQKFLMQFNILCKKGSQECSLYQWPYPTT